MKPLYLLIFFFTIPLFSLFANVEIESPSYIDSSNPALKEPRLMINNHPLAKINGKMISLYDVVKRMDLFLYNYNPDYTPPILEKYQFYMSRWETTLDDMIADELVLLDAEQKEIKISDGEIREDLEERFGPNIMTNLDKVNLQYEEAREIIRSELTVQQLIGMKVHAKAYQLTTPEAIKSAYTAYLETAPPEDEWKYQVLSIRGKNKDLCEKIAEKAYTLLQDKSLSLEAVASELNEEEISISVSENYSGVPSKISTMHFDVIKALTPDSVSGPISQVSRFDNSTVFRIFHLKETIENLPNTFDEMHEKLKNELLYKTADIEKTAYIDSLKVRFGYKNHNPKFALPEGYRPFVLI